MRYEFLIVEPGAKPRWTRLQGYGGEFGSGTLYLGWDRCKELVPNLLRRVQRERELVEHVPLPEGSGRSFSTVKLGAGTEVQDCRLVSG